MTVLHHIEKATDADMDKQDEYRRNAEYAREMAQHSGMPEDKAAWHRIASGWLSLLPHTEAGNGREEKCQKSQQNSRTQFNQHVRALGTRQKASGASH